MLNIFIKYFTTKYNNNLCVKKLMKDRTMSLNLNSFIASTKFKELSERC